MSTQSKRAAEVLRLAQQLDTRWMSAPYSTTGRDDSRCLVWMPFPLHAFVSMVAEALPETEGDRFLEIGAGIGTRMQVAGEIFGLDVQGIERVPEYVSEARSRGLTVAEADALGWDRYGDFDLIWFNKPFQDPDLQAQLEQQVWKDMKHGAVVICANLGDKPPASWWPVLDDWEVRRGIWQRP